MTILLIAFAAIAFYVGYRIGAGTSPKPREMRGVYFPPAARETFIAAESEGVRAFKAKQAQARVHFEDAD
jgi:hypothetical protein